MQPSLRDCCIGPTIKFVISTGAQRSGEICGFPNDDHRSWVPRVPTLGPGIPQIAKKTQVSFANLGYPAYTPKPQIPPLRFALSKIILEGVLCQRLWFPTLARQGWGTLDLLEVWIQSRHQSRVPHIWRALCARCGKPQISPLRFAPVEMTKLGVIADQTFLNPIFILLGGPRAHERSGRDDKVRCSCQPSLPQPDFHPLGWAAGP